MNDEILKMEIKNAAEFDGAGFLLYKGKPLDVENESMADLVLRKYKALGVSLKVVKDHHTFYFTRA